MRALLVGLLITACTRVHPQDASRIAPDLKRLEEATTDSARIVLLNWLCFNLRRQDPRKGSNTENGRSHWQTGPMPSAASLMRIRAWATAASA
ncbi:MAG: hypothetical protein IPI55_08600 [Flavobacteriales bacterium]|nr:hypothetical protein [Flavobacteriales bacterium]